MDPTRPQRGVFDEVAQLYDEVRPGYPAQLVDDALSLAALPDDGRILEVGCGSGQATRMFAPRGLEMVCLEPGAKLAALAAKNLSAHPNVQIVNACFEDWPAPTEPFQLLISAQAFHWIDPEVAFSKAAQVLDVRGAVALFWNGPLAGDSELRRAIDAAYAAHAPELAARLPGTRPRSGHGGPGNDIDASGLFGTVLTSRYPWSAEYGTSAYVKLMQTQSDHRMLPEARRNALLAAVGDAIERLGGSVRVDYVASLYFARRRA